MDDLIARLIAATGLPSETAQKAIAIILSFLEQAGPSDAVAKLIDAIPGAREAADAGPSSADDGGSMDHADTDIASLGGRLMEAGLDMGQMQALGQALFAFAAEKAGPDVVGQIIGGIPGLDQFV